MAGFNSTIDVNARPASATASATYGGRAFWAVILTAAALALWLRSGLPAEVWAGAGADDALFVRLAKQLIGGHWLGPFDDSTLVKGVGYPSFIALAFYLGVPLKMAETLLCLLCALAVSLFVARRSGSYAVGATLFVFFAFNPTFWSGDLNRVVREYLYATLSLASVLAMLLLTRPHRMLWQTVARAIGAGCIVAWFWLTREEGVWLLPSLLIALGGGAFLQRRRGDARKNVLASDLYLPIGVALATVLVIVSTVAGINRVKYGRYETVEVKSAPFERAYGSLYRIRSPNRPRYMILPRDVQGKLYAVSPAARELRPYFDGPRAEYWRHAGCEKYGPGQCSSIHTAFFQWALREAVRAAGHYQTAASSAAFYQRLANEIEAGCASRRLDCDGPYASLSPPFRAEFIADAVAVLPALLATYWRDGLHVVPPTASVVIPDEQVTDATTVATFGDIVGGYRPTAVEERTTRTGAAKRDRLILHIVRVIATAYAPIFVLLCISCPLAFAYLLRRGTDREQALVVLFLACGVGVASRCALLCYLDVTAIPVINAEYASPLSLLLITCGVGTPLVAANRLLMSRRLQRSPERAPNFVP